MAHIGIVGSGGWGTAMAVLLSNSGHSVTLWSYFEEECEQLKKHHENINLLPGVKIPDTVEFTNEISKCACEKDIIIIATPSHTVKQTSKTLAPFIKDGQIIVIISKGFDEENYLTLSQTVGNEITNAKIAVMSGPSHAEEVGKGMPTTNVVAHADHELAKYIQGVFMTNVFRVYTNTDVIGVELGGALKNVIALCVGICDGLGYGDNTKAALMTRGMAEIVRLGRAMGAHDSTFAGLSGIGDLIVTCTSMHSRNRRAGVLIGKGMTPEQARDEVKMVVEGIRTAKAAHHLAEKYNVDMPIVNEAYQILFEGKNPSDAVLDLMCRSEKNEDDNFYKN